MKKPWLFRVCSDLAISFQESYPDIFGHAVDVGNPAPVDR